MNWNIFQYNLYISDYNYTADSTVDKEMIIEPDAKDIECIKNNTNFVENLKYASVWTISDDNLYVLIEKWEADKGNQQSILLLEPK